jgi:diguanylate cyclase (GGDEF)-like protein/PAS domain S-box-containing protein
MTDSQQTNANQAGDGNAHAALAAMPESIVLTDRQGRISYLNPSARRLLSDYQDDLIGCPLHTVMLLVDETNGSAWNPLKDCLATRTPVDRSDLVLARNRPGGGIPVNVSAIPLPDTPEAGVMLVIRDTSVLKAQVKALTAVAQLDPLTQLPNRNLFTDRLEQALIQAKRDERQVAVLFLDLDNFKGVNDAYGHEVGDDLLKAVAKRLKACVRGGDSVGRYAGDEFTLLLTKLHQVKDAVRVVKKVQRALSRPVRVRGTELPVNASIGVSVYPVDGKRADHLLRAADGAMYHAKQQGKNCARFFTSEYNRLLPDQAMSEDQLRIAFEESQFQLYFQPRWDLREGRVVALEALLRWQHPSRGLVPASEFMRIAEQNGFIRPLGNWAVTEVGRYAAYWRDAGLPEVPINVNLSTHQFRHQDLPGLIAETMEQFKLRKGALELDVSEDALQDHAQLIIPILHRLKGLGADICISNFGSGAFSWRDLKQLPTHSLQLGFYLLQHLQTDPTDTAAADAALTFAHRLGRPISAAGVENNAQQAFLQDHGCHVMQGYLFDTPLPPEDIPKLLTRELSLEAVA